MKYRRWIYHNHYFDYSELVPSAFNPFMSVEYLIGTYSGIELFEHDIIRFNNQFYIIYTDLRLTQSKDFKVWVCPINIFVNRDPKLYYNTYWMFDSTKIRIKPEIALANFQLIGNIHQLEDLKL